MWILLQHLLCFLLCLSPGKWATSPALSSTRILTRSVFCLLRSVFSGLVYLLSAQGGCSFASSLATALLPPPPSGLLLLLFFKSRDTFVCSPLHPAFYFCALPPSSPPPHTCEQTPLRNVLLFLGRTQTWTHFSVVTYSRLVILAHYYYAVLYKHLNENCYGLLCLLDRPFSRFWER